MAPNKKAVKEEANNAEADYSGLEKDMRLQAEYDGKYYSAQVVEVSKGKKHKKAPVKVHFLGHGDDADEWLGADRIRSKHIVKAKSEAPKKEGKAAKAAKPKKERPPMEFEMGYWKIRGLGAVLRMILEYKEAKYTDTQYDQLDEWFKGENGKARILEKTPLANLPFVLTGNTCVVQTIPILNFLGSRLRLSGPNPAARLKNEQLLAETYDARNNHVGNVYGFNKKCRDAKEFEAAVPAIAQDPVFKGKYEVFLEKAGTDYFCGTKPCTADFFIWETLDQARLLADKFKRPDIFAETPKLKEFYDRFRALPTLAKYFESEAYTTFAINNPHAGAYFQR